MSVMSEEWRERLKTTRDTAKVVYDVLTEVLDNGAKMSVACWEHGIEYMRLRTMCERLAQFSIRGKRFPVSLAGAFPAEFAEKFYSELLGVEEEDAYKYMPDDPDESIDMALETLSEREREIIRKRINGATFEAIGSEYGVTRERVRQIYMRALRKLRHPSYMRILRLGVSGIADAEKEAARIKTETAVEAEKRREAIKAETARLLSVDKQYSADATLASLNANRAEVLSMSINVLELSVRPYNCLSRAGIKTIQDIVETGCERLSRMRNMGRKSLEEIVSKLRYFGITI